MQCVICVLRLRVQWWSVLRTGQNRRNQRSSLLFLFLFSTYSWIDERNKKIKCSAPQYIDLSMMFIQKTLNDENIFPTRLGKCLFSSLAAERKEISLCRSSISVVFRFTCSKDGSSSFPFRRSSLFRSLSSIDRSSTSSSFEQFLSSFRFVSDHIEHHFFWLFSCTYLFFFFFSSFVSIAVQWTHSDWCERTSLGIGNSRSSLSTLGETMATCLRSSIGTKT